MKKNKHKNNDSNKILKNKYDPNEKNLVKKFWKFIWYDDSILSYILNFVVAFIFIKFIFFPSIGFVLNNDYPIVAIVSGSMEHKIVDANICNKHISDIFSKSLDQNEWWKFCGDYYKQNFNLTLNNFKKFEYKNGLNIGDVMILYGKNPKNINVGEVLVFVPEDKTWFANNGPVIHRIVKKWQDNNGLYHFQTKGDHNPKSFKNFEDDIIETDIIGVSIVRVPYLGYPKLILSKIIGQI